VFLFVALHHTVLTADYLTIGVLIENKKKESEGLLSFLYKRFRTWLVDGLLVSFKVQHFYKKIKLQ